ncbi:RagB/SusD family nutrient uptake outer membrane protein [Dyadobacter arcticus]|uniref:RagB/SusD family nutrient uptake outer membrane protein n=1 Tax=Dyadobacter arcticus TaxID=1078754 RepID=UPI0035B5E9B7
MRQKRSTNGNDSTFTYIPTKVEDRVFTPKMYLYPIPQGEISISGALVQNPLW